MHADQSYETDLRVYVESQRFFVPSRSLNPSPQFNFTFPSSFSTSLQRWRFSFVLQINNDFGVGRVKSIYTKTIQKQKTTSQYIYKVV